MKKVLVTGGAGFIGSHVVEELRRRECDVYVVDNLSSGRKEHLDNFRFESNFFEENITDRATMEAVIAKVQPEWVFHLAAIHFIPYCNQHPAEAFQTNAMGTKVIIDSLSHVGVPKKFFVASTAAVYPPSPDAHREEEKVGPMDPYGLSKVCAEEMCQNFSSHSKVQCISGRLFNAVGPRETNPHLLPELVEQLNAGKREVQLGNLDPKRDFVHVRDMAKAITLAIEKLSDSYAVYNIGAGCQYSVREVVETCERILGEKITIHQDEKRIRKVERPSLLAGIDRIQAATDWKPTIDLEETLRELLD